MKKSSLFLIFRASFSLLLLTLLLWLAKENFVKIRQILSCVNIWVFVLAFLFFIAAIILITWRLKIILTAQRIVLGLHDLFSLTLIGYFFANFMPTSVGGDLVKGYYLSKKNKQKLTTSYACLFFDRLIGMFSIALIAAIALIMIGQGVGQRFVITSIVMLLFGCSGLILAILQKEWLSKIIRTCRIIRLLQVFKLEAAAREVVAPLALYARQKKVIVQAVALSLATQFLAFFSVFILAKSLWVYLPLERVFLIMPVIAVLCMLPITMNGLGLREWAFVFFFSGNIGNAAALSLSLLYLALYLLTSLWGGIIYLFWR